MLRLLIALMPRKVDSGLMKHLMSNVDAGSPGVSVPSRSLKILHVIDHLGLGGAQVLLVNLVSSHSDISQGTPTHEVLVLHGQDVYMEGLYKSGIPVRSLADSKHDLPAIALRLAAHLSRRDYDVVHLHLEASSLVGAWLAFFLSKAPVIVTGYSLKEQYHWPKFYVFSAIAPIVDAFVWLWKENNDLQSIGVKNRKIHTIPIGIDFKGADPDRHSEVRRKLCLQYNIAPERPLLLSVARFAANRHIHLLVEAMVSIVAECPEAALLMIGEGEERERLEAIIREHHLEGNIIFGGVRTDVWNLYPGCDIYMSSSGNCDTGVAAMQAMACARPVVAYTIAQMSEPQKLCECQGVFVQTRDPVAMAQATLSLLRHQDKAQQLGWRAREQVLQNFSLDRMVERYNTLYASVQDCRSTG